MRFDFSRGCACAGPFAHDLLGIDDSLSRRYTEILADDNGVTLEILKPGFARFNLPYFAPDEEIDFIIKAVTAIAKHGWEMLPYYKMNPETGGWHHHSTQLVSEHNPNLFKFVFAINKTVY